MIVRFSGDPDDLSERFERARRLWVDAQNGDYSPPVFYAVCKTDDGIVIVDGWETDDAHKAFGRRMEPHLTAVGMGSPDHLEHLSIEKLGWD
ncbi:MAG: hypothetical protein ACJ77Z_16775 [Thermoleophilaceae bacterium]